MLSYLKNIFVIILIVFTIWMIFFDKNSLLIHKELNKEIDKLDSEKEYYRKEMKKDNAILKELRSDEGLEKFAREEYYMKRKNEDIFIIEYQDSIKETKDE